jgi:hypothetical protein
MDLKQSIKERLAQHLREEEIAWFQRAKITVDGAKLCSSSPHAYE